MNISLQLCANNIAWDDFISKSPQGSVFVTSKFLKAQAAGLWQGWFLVEKSTVVAAAIVFFDSNNIELNAPRPFSMYQGVFLKPPSSSFQHKVVHENFYYLNKMIDAMAEKFSTLSWSLHHSLVDIRPFCWFNYHRPSEGVFKCKPFFTGILSLDPFGESVENFIKSIRPSRRNAWNKFKGKNFLVLQNECESKYFVDLYREMFDRQLAPVGNVDLCRVQSIYEKSIANGWGHSFSIFSSDGQLLSSVLILTFRDTVYYMFGVNSLAARDDDLGTICLISAIQFAIKNGFKFFDMVGINSPNRGDFKLSFGAEPTPYYLVDLKR